METENEIWKPVIGYEGHYEVSSLGRVRSVDKFVNTIGGGKAFRKGQILNGEINQGYLRVNLYKKNKSKHYKIHRLVMEAFMPNPDNLPEVNHIDENKLNNKLDNLEWCTTKYNLNYGTRIKRATKANINHPSKSKSVICIETGIIYPSTMEAERSLGIKGLNTRISSCCLRKNKYKTAAGYHWQYVDSRGIEDTDTNSDRE